MKGLKSTRPKTGAADNSCYVVQPSDLGNESDPITPDQLRQAKPKLKKEHYSWLFLSVWLGLRSREIDQLKDGRFVRLQCAVNGKPILWIYQTKLVSVPPQYRWKLIPIIFKEQEAALKVICSRTFRRPAVKIVKRNFGANTTLYGGRKGFTDLMLTHQQDFVHISQWMGHSSIERTRKSYKSRRITHFTPTGKAAGDGIISPSNKGCGSRSRC